MIAKVRKTKAIAMLISKINNNSNDKNQKNQTQISRIKLKVFEIHIYLNINKLLNF